MVRDGPYMSAELLVRKRWKVGDELFLYDEEVCELVEARVKDVIKGDEVLVVEFKRNCTSMVEEAWKYDCRVVPKDNMLMHNLTAFCKHFCRYVTGKK